MKAEELDKKFDDGEDVLDLFDLSTLNRPDIEAPLLCNPHVGEILQYEFLEELNIWVVGWLFFAVTLCL